MERFAKWMRKVLATATAALAATIVMAGTASARSIGLPGDDPASWSRTGHGAVQSSGTAPIQAPAGGSPGYWKYIVAAVAVAALVIVASAIATRLRRRPAPAVA